MIIAVASGKGGTGKTTIAASLVEVLHEEQQGAMLLDADVEAPNAHLTLAPEFQEEQPVHLRIPLIEEETCTGCGLCSEVCAFNALVQLGGTPMLFPDLCHGCGSCVLICPEGAIEEQAYRLGKLEGGMTAEGIRFGRGMMDIGRPMAVPIIAELKEWMLGPGGPGVVIDAPPGSSCPVVESLRGADFVLLVTEPTPFGLHDLQAAYRVTQEVGLPAGVIINRDGIGDQRVEEFCREVGLPVMLRIPFSREIGEGLAQGRSLLEVLPEYRDHFRDLIRTIEAGVKDGAGW